MAKVLEESQLKLNRKDLRINTSQHAFTEDKSTVTTLASITQGWYNATDRGTPHNGVQVVFVDFRKAFNLVDLRLLLSKLWNGS